VLHGLKRNARIALMGILFRQCRQCRHFSSDNADSFQAVNFNQFFEIEFGYSHIRINDAK
jgi:hypothetical protein